MEMEAQVKNGKIKLKWESGLTSALRTPRSLQTPRKHKSYVFEGAEKAESKGNVADFSQEQPRDVIFYLDIELDGSTEPPKIKLEVAPDYLVSEAVINALEKFNEVLKPHGIKLPLDINLYYPRLPKKTGRPKLDMPSLDYKQKLFVTKVIAVSLQIKDKEAMFRAVTEEEQNKQTTVSTGIEGDMTFEKKEVEIKPEERPEKKSVCFSSVCWCRRGFTTLDTIFSV